MLELSSYVAHLKRLYYITTVHILGCHFISCSKFHLYWHWQGYHKTRRDYFTNTQAVESNVSHSKRAYEWINTVGMQLLEWRLLRPAYGWLLVMFPSKASCRVSELWYNLIKKSWPDLQTENYTSMTKKFKMYLRGNTTGVNAVDNYNFPVYYSKWPY